MLYIVANLIISDSVLAIFAIRKVLYLLTVDTNVEASPSKNCYKIISKK